MMIIFVLLCLCRSSKNTEKDRRPGEKPPVFFNEFM